jgi:hypothetical protein
MLPDLTALAAPVIVGLAFLVGLGALLRHELAPRRRGRREAVGAGETGRERGDGS